MKKILFISFLTFAFFGVFGQTKIAAVLVRNNPADTYPVTSDTLQRGGMMVFSSITNRDALPQELRKVGMLAAVDTVVYQLKGGTANVNWSLFKPGGTVVTPNTIFTGGTMNINTTIDRNGKDLEYVNNVGAASDYELSSTNVRVSEYNNGTSLYNEYTSPTFTNNQLTTNLGVQGIRQVAEQRTVIGSPFYEMLVKGLGAQSYRGIKIDSSSVYLGNMSAGAGNETVIIDGTTNKVKIKSLKNNLALDSIVSTDTAGNLKNISKSSLGGVQNLQSVLDNGNTALGQEITLLNSDGSKMFIGNNQIGINDANNDLKIWITEERFLNQYPSGNLKFAMDYNNGGGRQLLGNDSGGITAIKIPLNTNVQTGLLYPIYGTAERVLPLSVNGQFANAAGEISLGAVAQADTQYLRRDLNLKIDSLRNNNGTLEGLVNFIWKPQLVLPSSTNIYNTDGTLTGPRRMNGNGYLLKLDSAKLSIQDTTATSGHLYDFNNGVSFVDYGNTNTSSLIQTEISGIKFATIDRNNFDTSNNLWVKPGSLELNSTTHIDINGKTQFPATYTTAGTTGNQTINKNSGSVNIAAAATTITVTNNLVTANTIVSARVSTNDATAEILNVVSVTNGFIITMATPATNETQIKFWITN